MRHFTRPFRHLQGRLTVSYTLTSVVIFLLVEVVVIGIAFWIFGLNVSYIFSTISNQEAPLAAPYFVHGSADREALTSWLQIMHDTPPNKQGIFNFSQLIYITVVDTQGRTIASVGIHPVLPNTPLQAQLSPQNRADLLTILHRVKGTTSAIDQDTNGMLVAMTTIVGQRGNVEGAFVMKVVAPDNLHLIVAYLQFVAFSVTIATIYATVSGLISGYLTARGLARRLKNLSTVADRWGGGDFSVLAHDTSDDELGQMSRQLNRMATQLWNLLSTRQKLATLEERNRLARDLHDSVKQQVFAVAMQIGATQTLLKRDPAAAEVRLKEAQKLVSQVQQELTSLISELRPAALNGKGIVAALRELTTQWTQQTNIVATLRAKSHETLPLAVEEALFRVAQEALSNIARHSKATLVQMDLTTTDDTVILSITDNGQGFDTAHRNGSGLGLLSMQERMKTLGGDAQFESTPDKGTRIIAQCKRLGVSISDITPPPNNSHDDMEHI